MKKLIIPVFAALAMLMASCEKDSYYHTFTFNPYYNSPGYAYADQTFDTIRVVTTDQYVVTLEKDWQSIASEYAKPNIKYIYGGIYNLNVPVTFSTNTTGKSRTNYIFFNVTGDDDWSQRATFAYTQFYWLDVQIPSPRYTNSGKDCTFERVNKSVTTKDSLCFHVEKDWTLSIPSGSFVKADTLAGPAGNNKVYLRLTPNMTQDTLVSTITLQSSGVETPITYKQAPAKRD